MKTFKNNKGRGFHITFPNGVCLSTQFAWGNYCENNKGFGLFGDGGVAKVDWESNDAEIAIIGPDGKWLTKEFEDAGDDVIGHVAIDKWLKAFDFCRNWKDSTHA